MQEFLDFLLDSRQFLGFGFENILRGGQRLSLILFLLIIDHRQLLLIDINKLIDIPKFLLDQLELLLEIGCVGGTFGGDFDLIEDLVDCLAQFVKLVAVFFVLYLEGDDVALVVLLGFPFLGEEVLGGWGVGLGFGEQFLGGGGVAEKVHFVID